MREILFDLTEDFYFPKSAFGGYEGEHNETRLTLRLPSRLITSDAVYYMVFETEKNDEVIFSAPLLAEKNAISAVLPKQVMLSPRITVHAASYRKKGEELVQIAKSGRVILEIKYPESELQIRLSEDGGKIPGLEIEEAVLPDSENPVSSRALFEEISALEQNQVQTAFVNGDGDLILQKKNRVQISAGNVIGPQGPRGLQGEKGDHGEQGEPGKDVDYNLVANALKGAASGTAVVLKDVSPLPHGITVKLEGQTELIEIASEGSYSCDVEGPGDYVIENLEEIEGECYITFANGYVAINTFAGNTSIYDLDYGDTVRIDEDYTVWLVKCLTDLSAVTLLKYGKNLFNENVDYGVGVMEENGEKIFYNAESGKEEYLGLLVTDIWDLAYMLGKNLTISFDIKSAKAGKMEIYSLGKKELGRITGDRYNNNITTEWQRMSFTAKPIYMEEGTNGEKCTLSFYGKYGSGVAPFVKNIQFELGDSVSEYEPYKKPVGYLPETDGTVNGVIGNGENMTLVTDTEGVTVTAEYNRDINKAFAELCQDIAALGSAAVTIPEEG